MTYTKLLILLLWLTPHLKAADTFPTGEQSNYFSGLPPYGEASLFESVSEIVGHPLDEAQKKGLLKAYGQNNLTLKMKTLQDAGFSSNERKRIVREGLSGCTLMIRIINFLRRK